MHGSLTGRRRGVTLPATMRPLLALLSLAMLSATATAHADAPRGDGLYGRWDEDLVLSFGAGSGVAVGENVDPARAQLVGSASMRFYGAAGPLVAGAWAPSAPQHVFVGVEVRPLFPGVFLLDMSTGRAFVDLFLQSLALELGAAFLVDGERSVGLAFGVAVEVPLVRPDVFGQGFWLRLGMRRIAASSRFQSVEREAESHYVLQASLVISAGIDSGMQNAEPPRFR